MGAPPPFPLPVPGERRTHKLPSGRWIDVLCTELGDGGEKVVDFRDVTAAKELEEAKDLFLATTSHELRTPITVVQGFASTLASRWEQLSDADRRAAVRTIAERAGSLGRLVEQLLLGARAGADALPVTNGPFDLAALLRAAVVSFSPLSDKHQVVADVPDDLPLASGDSMATDIIVGQLLENAFKYSPSGGTVTVRARGVGPMIEVDVEDEGIGIAPGDHERIFERFVQGETGDRRRFGGVGIGLYIVRRLAIAQHGTVVAMTRPEGGTIMRLTLQRASGLAGSYSRACSRWRGSPPVAARYSSMTPGTSSLSRRIWPASIQITRLQLCSISPRLWATRKTVPASSRSSLIRLWLLVRNAASPVASASSIIRISWLLADAIANRRRWAMPVE